MFFKIDSSSVLNEEIAVGLHQKMLTRDDYFKEYQNFTGAALSSAAILLSDILNDEEVPLVREDIFKNLSTTVRRLSDLFGHLTQARKILTVGRYDGKIQKC